MSGLLPVEVCGRCLAPLPRCHCAVARGHSLAKQVPRWRSVKYLRFVKSLPCAVPGCRHGGSYVEAAHFGPRAASRKVHDFLAVPLCRPHHAESHQEGRAWAHYDEVTAYQLRTVAAAIASGVLVEGRGR